MAFPCFDTSTKSVALTGLTTLSGTAFWKIFELVFSFQLQKWSSLDFLIGGSHQIISKHRWWPRTILRQLWMCSPQFNNFFYVFIIIFLSRRVSRGELCIYVRPKILDHSWRFLFDTCLMTIWISSYPLPNCIDYCWPDLDFWEFFVSFDVI